MNKLELDICQIKGSIIQNKRKIQTSYTNLLLTFCSNAPFKFKTKKIFTRKLIITKTKHRHIFN